MGRRHNGAREANLQRETIDKKKSQATGATRPAAQPQGESNGGELIDGEMIYIDNGATVDSITTCSHTESADADHSNQEEAPLEQPSQTYTNGGEQTSNARDTQDQTTEN